MITLNSDIFYVGLGCFIVSFVICKLMVLVNLSDSPSYRSIHNKTNPTGGGLGIITTIGGSGKKKGKIKTKGGKKQFNDYDDWS